MRPRFASTRGWIIAWSAVRVIVAALMIAGVIVQLRRTVNNALTDGDHLPTVVANYFSYFTILSNTIGALVLLWAVVWTFRAVRGERVDAGGTATPKHPLVPTEPRGLATSLAAVSTYLIITGIVYNLLLRGIQPPDPGTEWINEVHHVVAPALMLLDLFVGPLRRRLSWWTPLLSVVFPLAWVTYTMVRGPLITSPVTGNPWWYPYPFLDPNRAGGWASVWVYIVVIAVAIIAVTALTVVIARLRTPATTVGATDAGARARREP